MQKAYLNLPFFDLRNVGKPFSSPPVTLPAQFFIYFHCLVNADDIYFPHSLYMFPFLLSILSQATINIPPCITIVLPLTFSPIPTPPRLTLMNLCIEAICPEFFYYCAGPPQADHYMTRSFCSEYFLLLFK